MPEKISLGPYENQRHDQERKKDMVLTDRLLVYGSKRERWLLLNTLTGAVDLLDKEGWEQFGRIREGDFSSVPAYLIRHLQRRGYLLRDKDEEEELLRGMFEQDARRFSQAPVKALILPTFACNLRCIYCFQGSLRERVPLHLTDEEIPKLFRALDKIIARENVPGAQIEISGGEPLLASSYRVIACILDLALQRKYPVGMVTNGVNLVGFGPLLEKYHSSIKNVQVTIDGPAPVHNRRRRYPGGKGSFEKIIEGVDLLLRLDIPTVIRVNVDLENVETLPELARIMMRKRWTEKPHFRARLAKVESHGEVEEREANLYEYLLVQKIESLTSEYPWMKEVFVDTRISRILGQLAKVIEKRYREYVPNFFYCEATSTGLFVFAADGLLYSCGESAGNSRFAVGRFLPTLKIDEEKLGYWKHQNIVEIPECYSCPIACHCGGGCPYQNLRISEKSRRRLCTVRKKVLERYMSSHIEELTARPRPRAAGFSKTELVSAAE